MLRPRYVILGGGISGLALGCFLKQRYQEKVQLTILEASKRPGGWIQTLQKEGFLFEQGPRSLRPEGAGLATLQLIEALGLQNEYIPASVNAKKRYLYVDKKLKALPHNIGSLITSPFTIPILRALWKDWRSPKETFTDESIYHFVERRFGTYVAETFFDPLVSGIYAGDIHKLSLKSCFPFLNELEQHHHCILKGVFAKKTKLEDPLSPFLEKVRHQGIFTLRQGMESLVNALSNILRQELKLNSFAQELRFQQGKTIIHLQNTQQIIADKLFLALPPKSLEKLFANSKPSIAKILHTIPCASIASINFGYHSPVLKKEGFGYLIPSKERQNLLGVVWDSSAFPQQNAHPQQTRLTAMLGGVLGIDLNTYNDDQLIKLAQEEIKLHLGIDQKPDIIHLKRAPQAIPQYTVGHHKRITKLESLFKELPADITLLGNAFYGISVNDCIAHAKKVALNPKFPVFYN